MTTGSSGVPLYTLYRRQRGIIDNANVIQKVAPPASNFPELACQLNGSFVSFWRPDDLNVPDAPVRCEHNDGLCHWIRS